MEKVISFKSKFGWINAKERNNLLISISFGKLKSKGSSQNLKRFKKLITKYFNGKEVNWNFQLEINGSNLQKKIWKELSKIPYGETKTYKHIAKKCHTSARYVGNVCGQNKHLIIIPCHRVIRSDGTLGGFSSLGGIKLKQKLINLEN